LTSTPLAGILAWDRQRNGINPFSVVAFLFSIFNFQFSCSLDFPSSRDLRPATAPIPEYASKCLRFLRMEFIPSEALSRQREVRSRGTVFAPSAFQRPGAREPARAWVRLLPSSRTAPPMSTVFADFAVFADVYFCPIFNGLQQKPPHNGVTGNRARSCSEPYRRHLGGTTYVRLPWLSWPVPLRFQF